MPFVRRLPRVAGAILALTVAFGSSSCGDSSTSTQPAPLSQEQSDDIAAQLAASSSASGWGSFVLSGGLDASPVVSHGPAVPFQATAWDTTFTTGGLTYTFHVGFFTIGGVEHDRYNPLLTWKVSEDSDVQGTIALAHYQAGYFHTGHLDFYGMRATDDTLSFTGTAHDTAFASFDAPFRPVTRYCHLDVVRTIDDVRIVKSTSTYPASGSVQWVVAATYLRSASRADVEVVIHASATMTFNGTRYAVLTVTGGASYTFDLETGAIARIQA